MELFRSLTDGTARGTLHVWNGDRFDHLPWPEVAADAHGMAATLRAAGVRPGTRVACVLTNTADTVRGLLAIWLAGGAVASLPLPTRGQSLQAYGEQLCALCARLDPTLMLLDDWLVPMVPDQLRKELPIRGWAALRGGGRLDPSPPGRDDLAFIQYSSGSTSTPKGCAITTGSIQEQLAIILHLTGGRPGADTVASWLPLSHDMGMFGCLLYSWAYDFDFVLSSPERFGMGPRTWFHDMSEYQATMTAGTSTAVYLATRAQGSAALPKPLRLRAAVIGAERIDARTLAAATERFGPWGLSDTAFQPAYGMAEATLAVTGKPWAQAPRIRAFDGEALVEGETVETAPDHPKATLLVSNGVALPGVSVRAGGAGRIAEIEVASPSLADGYYRDPERTGQRFQDGRLRTGDLGFMLDDELYVLSRVDDMLSVGGRKVHACEIESEVDSLTHIRKGCAALVDASSSAGAQLVLLVEPMGRPRDFRPIAEQAAALAMDKAGVALSECLFLPRGTLPKTPSGKIQRFRCRALLQQGLFEPVARVRLDG